MKKTLAAVTCVLVASAVLLVREREAEAPAGLTGSVPAVPAAAHKRPVTLLFAGDIMLSRHIEKMVEERGGGDWSYPYALMGDLIASADVAFANLETPVSERGTKVGSIYSFRTDPRALPALKAAGFDAVSIANNHMWDYGREAFLDTLGHLASAGISYAGGGRNYAEAHAPAIIESNGHKIAFLAYTDLLPGFLLRPTSSPAVAFPSLAAVRKDVALASESADIVIASFHWGEEYVRSHNAAQEELAKAAIDAGALIVMGHHPHTPQEIERYKGGVILYSLGNFVFDQNFDEFTRTGLIAEIGIDEKGSIASVTPTEIRFNSTYQPFVPERE